MKHSALWFTIIIVLAACGQLDSIPYRPAQTPESWLHIQPVVNVQIAGQPLLIVQPSTSIIVYVFGLLTIGAGLYFLRIRHAQRSRLWWGLALILWGGGALLAGTSYEAFSYQIKCAGREACMWTSWWEIAYLIVSAASVDALLIAQAYACARGRGRKALISYAVINLAVYVLLVLIGTLIPVQFLISFEFLLVAAAPGLVILIGMSSWRYDKYRQSKDLALLGTWLWLVLTIAAYFLYYISGMTQTLWARQVWFTENDVLHLGLLGWVIYIVLVVSRRVEDEPTSFVGRKSSG
jgi:hypothetical protein